MAGMVGEIARDAQQQCSDIDAVARKIAAVEISNRENSSLLQRARESARELQLLAGELGGAVGRFHIDGTPSTADEKGSGVHPRAARA
jgi:methyl-accepting chemotaxis protein